MTGIGHEADGRAASGPAPLPSVANSALHETVVDALRQAIAQGRFAPGEHLREADLADAMQVSRGPIREALTQLEREGLVVLRRHRGAQVVELSRVDVEEVYTLRMALERLAVRRAAELARDEHFAEMDGVLAQMTELDADYDSKRAASLDVAFHDIIYRAADHARLYRAWQQIRSQVYVFLYSRSVAIHDFNDIAFEHGELRDLLARRDADAAVRTIEGHLDGAYRRLRSSFEEA